MPCYDGTNGSCCNSNYPSTERAIEYIKVDNEDDKNKILLQQDKIRWLEAALCAVISELESKGICFEVLNNANKNGIISLFQFWNYHKKEDESRLSVELAKYSEHELSVIKNILNNKK